MVIEYLLLEGQGQGASYMYERSLPCAHVANICTRTQHGKLQ